jgi:hypothetical protein
MNWLEFVKVLVPLGWPIVTVIVTLLLKGEIFTFLRTILQRNFEFELPGGFKGKVDAAEQQKSADQNPAAKELTEAAPNPSQSPALNRIVTELQNALTKIDKQARETTLVRALAETRLRAGHEFLYNRIFGSQISALKRLNEIGQATVDDARQFFKPYAEQFPQLYSKYGFDKWAGFLESNGLVVQKDGLMEISDFGRDFLVYLTTMRLPENKPW